MKRNKWAMPRHRPIKDPRIAIAEHIGWVRPIRDDTDFHIPEPDNFNYAVLDYQPRPCPHIINQVFYKDMQTNLWWTVYLVMFQDEKDFFAWADPIEFVQCWSNSRSSKLRKRKPLLYVKKGASEQSLQERLYTMGYYDDLSKKCQDPATVSSVLGTPRDQIPYYNDGSKWAEVNTDTTEMEL
jgi:hypothetical protein